jgi:hypothetical protein
LAPRLGRTGSKICPAAAIGFMIYEDIEFVIRAGLGRHEWTLLICYPDNVDRNPTVSQFSGSIGDATAAARRRIDGWMRRQRQRRPPPSEPHNSSQ